MFSYSLAFAIPFTLFAIFPEWIKGLPKSGGWLNSVKVTLGFLELALCWKFFSIADQAYHWGILDRDVNIALWIVIFTLLGVYFLGKIRMKGDSEVPTVTVPRLMLAIPVFAFVVYLIPGMWGAPLKMLAGYLPPTSTLDFDLVADALEETGCPQDIECNQCSGAGAYRSSLGPCVRCGYEGRLPNPILDHLRSPGPHVRGCWALDLARGENVT
jgi:hypothetical protein